MKSSIETLQVSNDVLGNITYEGQVMRDFFEMFDPLGNEVIPNSKILLPYFNATNSTDHGMSAFGHLGLGPILS